MIAPTGISLAGKSYAPVIRVTPNSFRILNPEYAGDMLARLARLRCVPLIILLAAAAACRAESLPSTSSIFSEGFGAGAVKLIGPWKFHTGDDPRWASPFFDDSDWHAIRGNLPWGRQGYARYTGYGWYRIHVPVASSPENPRQFSLLVPQIHDVYEIFWNGNLVGRDGKMPPWPEWRVSRQPLIFRIADQHGGVLAFRIWKAPLFSDDPGERGGFYGAPFVGNADAIAAVKSSFDYEWLRTRQLEFAEQLIYGLVALLSFLTWWWNRAQRALLCMMGYALMPLVVVLLLDAHLALPYSVAMGLTQPANCIHDVSLWFLLLWLLQLHEDGRLLGVTRVFAIVSLILTSVDGFLLGRAWRPDWVKPVQAADATITTVTTLFEVLPIVLIAVAFRRKRRLGMASWIVAGMTILDGMFLAVQEALRQGQRFTGWTIGERLREPLFSINGNGVTTATLLRGLLLIAIVTAVYISYRKERRIEMLLAHEFSSARELQRVLIPENQHSVPGFAVSSCYCPALEVGGDFFQLIASQSDPNGSALLLLGDVSGHGLRAALSVSYVIGITRVLAELFVQPGALLTEMNRRLCGQLESAFVTCIAVQIDRLGNCTLSSAGHPPPFLNWSALEVPGALPLGMDATARYDQMTVQFRPGDHLALYTDGLLEARNKVGELYGFDRLQKLFAANPTAPQAAEEAVRFGQDDDVTVVTLAYTGGDGTVPTQVVEADLIRSA